ncbi:21122_t:CDS:2, partial [Entrophospora sp. SA101]
SPQIDKMKERLERLKQLRLRKDDAEQANRKDLYEEHQRKKTNPKELIHIQRLREEAEKLQERQEAIENGEDYERKKFWEYSAEAVEKWEKKQQKKLKRSSPYDPYIPKEGAAGGPPSKTLEIQKKIDETVEVMRDNLKSVAERG